MQSIACILSLLALLSHSFQEKDNWQRLYTYEDTAVDIDTSNIIFSTDFTGRVRFRLTLSKPQSVTGDGKDKYKSVIEAMEFKCPQRLYRVVDVKRYDGKGNLVDSNEAQQSAEWKDVKAKGMMEKFLKAGCDAIYEKRRNP